MQREGMLQAYGVEIARIVAPQSSSVDQCHLSYCVLVCRQRLQKVQEALQQQESAVQQEGLARVQAAQKWTDEAVTVGQQPVVLGQQIWQAPAYE